MAPPKVHLAAFSGPRQWWKMTPKSLVLHCSALLLWV